MKFLLVKKINFAGFALGQLSQVMDKEAVDYLPLSEINWPEYPYRPDVRFRMAHDGQHIFLQYRVEEESIRARYGEDGGQVWTDSCVEFFLCFPEDDFYYNLECNCIGTVLLGSGKSNKNRENAPEDITRKIERISSLGRVPFELRTGNFAWNVSLIIPTEVFMLSSGGEISGKKVRGNFYKCGDELKTPHFLSWNKIDHPVPNFHLPEFFGEIEFE